MMSMFCYQCQETAKNQGCTVRGVCGKTEETADLQDLLVYVLKGISIWEEKAKELGARDKQVGRFVAEALFATITNANFDSDRIVDLIKKALQIRDSLKTQVTQTDKGQGSAENTHDCATWSADDSEAFLAKGKEVGILATDNEDIRSLRWLVTYGIKGLSAYAEHAATLGYEDDDIYAFLMEALSATTRDLSIDELVALTMKAGEIGVKTMALLDKANAETYGNPEITEVNIGVGKNPGILISGHDLKDMEELLEQTEGSGVDVYTHSEMLPANYYPAFKKYDHFIGNYGNAWWKQNSEFESFNGPILLTTNCIIPVKDSYKDRIFTTNMVGYPSVKHIPDRPEAGKKDFSEIVELAKSCPSPTEIETGTITGGFAHDQVLKLADKVVEAVKSGAIKRFIVMAGCDGRHKTRHYYADVAQNLPDDAVILTAGCAKYRYIKLGLGDIPIRDASGNTVGGIPRVLDAGQCNDCYSLAVVAMKLQEVFGLEDINDLPISYDIAWYEQKAVVVFLALLFLGIKGIRLGPTLPGFLSANVAKVLVENFDIKPIGEVEADVEAMMKGE